MKIAAAVTTSVLITKEMEVSDEQLKQLKQNPTIQFPMSPNDKPVVKTVLDVFDEDCNLLFSIGRNINDKL